MRITVPLALCLALAVLGACSSGGGASVAAFCKEVKNVRTSNGGIDLSTEAAKNKTLEHSVSQLNSVLDKSPAAIKADVQVLYNYLFALVKRDTSTLKNMDSQVRSAEAHFKTYTDTNCGTGSTTTTTTK